MSFKVRSALVIVVGTVLGLGVSLVGSVLAELEPPPAPAQEQDRAVALLTEVVNRIRREYVDSIDEQTLVESAIRGMLEELDPHSKYLDPSAYEDIRIATTGNYSGVGLDVSVRDGRVTVISPVDDAPAAKAGIRAGDVVVSIDDVAVDDENVEETVNLMRGRPGTEVRVGVERDGAEGPLSFSLTRAEIRVQTVRSTYLGDGVGYIRISGFSDSTPDELDRVALALEGAAGRPLRAVVLDLRNNPGGVLGSAIAVSDRFLESGLIVRGNGRVHQARFAQYASPGDALEKVALAVLVNAGSASGAEILAGAIKDHDRGTLVGERTYGKGSVQSVVPLGEGSALKLTTARYFTPSGRSINGTGIRPDAIVHSGDPASVYRGPGSRVAIAADRQLSEALRIIGYEAISLSQAP